MKATMTTTMEAVWANQIELSVEAQLDNLDEATTREVVEGMTWTLRTMGERVREQNERTTDGAPRIERDERAHDGAEHDGHRPHRAAVR